MISTAKSSDARSYLEDIFQNHYRVKSKYIYLHVSQEMDRI